jgi:hypothetical protein
MATQPLFGEAFIMDVCLGTVDDDVAARIRRAAEAVGEDLSLAVTEAMGRDSEMADFAQYVQVTAEDGELVVTLPEEVVDEVLDREFGDVDTPPTPVIRSAVRRSLLRSRTVFDSVVRGGE